MTLLYAWERALKRLRNDESIVILPADKGRLTVVMVKIDHFDKMDALVNDKQTYEEIKSDLTPGLQRKLNSKILTLKKKTDAVDTQRYYWLRCQCHNHRNCTHYRNCTNLVCKCDLYPHSVDPLRISCLNTWRPYCNPLLTNHEVNYILRRTLLMPLRRCRYLTTTNLCLLMWNHCSSVFHSVRRPLSNNLPVN